MTYSTMSVRISNNYAIIADAGTDLPHREMYANSIYLLMLMYVFEREGEEENVIPVNKKVENMQIVCHFFPSVFVVFI